MMRFLEQYRDGIQTAVRVVVGWHLAYLGVWALTTRGSYSWYGCFHGAHWIFGRAFRALADAAAFGAVDGVIAWGLLLAGFLLMVGRLVKPAAIFGIVYLALTYVVNPPHFGHTGESHFLFVDRNVIEVVLLFAVMFVRREKEVSHV